MNITVLARDYGISPRESVRSEDWKWYLAGLTAMASVGGISIEEELWVQAWIDYLDLDPLLVKAARNLALAPEFPRQGLLGRIDHLRLRRHLIRDALRLCSLEGGIRPEEITLLLHFWADQPVSQRMLEEAMRQVQREDQLLQMFATLARRQEPWPPEAAPVLHGLDRVRREQTLLLPHPERLDPGELQAALALLYRCKGLCSPSRESRAYVRTVVEALHLDDATREEAHRLAWMEFDLSFHDLLVRLRDQALRHVFLRDLFRLGTLDGALSARERQVFAGVARSFSLDDSLTEDLLQRLAEERHVQQRLREMLDTLLPSPSPAHED